MNAKIIPIAQLQQRYSGSYSFTTTETPDPDYRKYLARQLRPVLPQGIEAAPPDATPLDISLDDLEGDVVAGIAALMIGSLLRIDLLWVGEPLRGGGIGSRLMLMAEEHAIERGCTQARLRTSVGVPFFVGRGYSISGVVQQLPFKPEMPPAHAVYWMTKDLSD